MRRFLSIAAAIFFLGVGCGRATQPEFFLRTVNSVSPDEVDQALYVRGADGVVKMLVPSVHAALGDWLQDGRFLVLEKKSSGGNQLVFGVGCNEVCVGDAAYVFDVVARQFVKNGATELMSNYDGSPLFFSVDGRFLALLRTPLKSPQSVSLIDLAQLRVVKRADLDAVENYFHRASSSETLVVSSETRWISATDFQVALFEDDAASIQPIKRYLKISL